MSPLRKALLVAVAVGTVGIYVWSFTLSTTRDRPDELDTGPVMTAARTACANLRLGLAALPPLGADPPPAARAARADEHSRLVRRLVTDVRAVGQRDLAADVPAAEWLADWESLADARAAYAAGGGGGPYTTPEADGRPVTERMGRIGVPACVVPTPLATPP